MLSALRWYVEGFSTRSGITADVEIPNKIVRLERDIELALFRVLQESLTNVHRHSGSKTVAIRIGLDSRRVWLEVEDKGKRNPSIGRKRGVGVTGMRERVQHLAGEFSIRSSPNGTSVRAVLPLLSKANRSRSLRSQAKRLTNVVAMYEWQQLVLDAFVEQQTKQRALKVNAAERAISARLCHRQAPDLNEHIALRDALQSLRSLFPQAQTETDAVDDTQSA